MGARWRRLDRKKNVYDSHGGLIRGGFCKNLYASPWLPIVEFIYKISRIVPKTMSAAFFKCVYGNWRYTNLAAITKFGREQEVFHA